MQALTSGVCVAESRRDVPASWNNDKIFAAAYVRFPTLWNPGATEVLYSIYYIYLEPVSLVRDKVSDNL